MLRLALTGLVVGFSSWANPAQALAAPQSTPDPYEAQRMIRRTDQSARRFEGMRSRGQDFGALDRRIRNTLLQQHFRELYRKPDGSEIEMLRPSAELRARYRDFVNGSESGLIVLAPNFDCARNAIVVNASERCVRFNFPGAGSSYSFRYNTYRIPRLSDISFTGERFLTVGDFTQGIITAIGDVPIEHVSIGTVGMGFLRSFEPARHLEDAAKTESDLIVGIAHGGLKYKRSWEANADTTYLLRSVAYRGQSMRLFENVTYDEFEFDKRRDVIVAFRVVEIQAGGNLTIVWKKLSDEKSPSVSNVMVQEK